MLNKIVVLFCVLLNGVFGQIQPASTTTTSPYQNEEDKCIIPPQIKNGHFVAEGNWDPPPKEGDRAYSFVLKVTCDPGFHLTGFYLVQCVTDKLLDKMPQCVPICKKETPDLMSCGLGYNNEVSRCLIPEETTGSSPSTNKVRKKLQCGVIPNVVKASVAGGRIASIEEVPWYVTVYTKVTKPYIQMCGGTLVSNRLVISAAHCFWNELTKQQPASLYAVAVGKLYRSWTYKYDSNAQRSGVQEIRIPPRYQGRATNFQDDIALLITKDEIRFTTFVTPACLDFDFDFDVTQLAHGKLARVAGFGLTSQDGTASHVLKVVEMPSVGIEECIRTSDPGFVVSITSDKICAGLTNGTAVCRGDSGGGLAVPDIVGEAERYYLRGIVSTAPKNDHLCNTFAVATFTHVIKHAHFIGKALADTTTREIKLPPKPKDLTTTTKKPTTTPVTHEPVHRIVTNIRKGISHENVKGGHKSDVNGHKTGDDSKYNENTSEEDDNEDNCPILPININLDPTTAVPEDISHNNHETTKNHNNSPEETTKIDVTTSKTFNYVKIPGEGILKSNPNTHIDTSPKIVQKDKTVDKAIIDMSNHYVSRDYNITRIKNERVGSEDSKKNDDNKFSVPIKPADNVPSIFDDSTYFNHDLTIGTKTNAPNATLHDTNKSQKGPTTDFRDVFKKVSTKMVYNVNFRPRATTSSYITDTTPIPIKIKETKNPEYQIIVTPPSQYWVTHTLPSQHHPWLVFHNTYQSDNNKDDDISFNDKNWPRIQNMPTNHEFLFNPQSSLNPTVQILEKDLHTKQNSPNTNIKSHKDINVPLHHQKVILNAKTNRQSSHQNMDMTPQKDHDTKTGHENVEFNKQVTQNVKIKQVDVDLNQNIKLKPVDLNIKIDEVDLHPELSQNVKFSDKNDDFGQPLISSFKISHSNIALHPQHNQNGKISYDGDFNHNIVLSQNVKPSPQTVENQKHVPNDKISQQNVDLHPELNQNVKRSHQNVDLRADINEHVKSGHHVDIHSKLTPNVDFDKQPANVLKNHQNADEVFNLGHQNVKFKSGRPIVELKHHHNVKLNHHNDEKRHHNVKISQHVDEPHKLSSRNVPQIPVPIISEEVHSQGHYGTVYHTYVPSLIYKWPHNVDRWQYSY